MADELSNISELKNLTEAQFRALNNLSDTLNSCSHGESLIENVVDILIEVTNAERGLFATYNHEKFEFSIISARNIEKESISDLSSFSSGVLQQVINDNNPILFHDVQSNPKLSQFESVQLHNIKSVLGVPVRKDNKIWGVILVDSKKDRKEFTDKNLLFLKYFSNLVSLTLQKLFEIENLYDENLRLKNVLQSVNKIPDMIGESEPMLNLSRTISRVAETDATV